MLIMQGVPPLGGVKQWWGGKTSYFVAKCVDISMSLDDLELYKFEFSENFLGFRRFRTQQHLNE